MNSILLSIINVKKLYGSKEALRGVSLEIRSGEIVSLLGVNGAGKTTLSSIIASLHPASAGDLLFNGTSIYQDITEYRRHIGYCPQRPNLNNALTVRQNLLFAGRFFCMLETDVIQRVEQLITQLNLEEYIDALPGTLSGGYKQRVMIARSIIHNPKLVILDEPTVGLDPHIRKQLWETIKQMKQQGISVLLTTHYLDEAEVLSDRVCVLDRGLIRLIDTPQNLMSSFKKKNLEDVFLHLVDEQA